MIKLRLLWTDPVSQRHRHPLLNTPIALGSTFKSMPVEISGKSVSRMVIGDRQVQDFHALLVEVEGEIYLIDNLGQTFVNQRPVTGQAQLHPGDCIRIGSTEIQFEMISTPGARPSGQQTTHLQAIPGGLNQPPQQSFSPNGNGRPSRASNPAPGDASTASSARSMGHHPISNGNHRSVNRPIHIVPDPSPTPDPITNFPDHNSPQDPFRTHSQSDIPTGPGSASPEQQSAPHNPSNPAGANSAASPSSAAPSHPNGQSATGQNGRQNHAPTHHGGHQNHAPSNPPLQSRAWRQAVTPQPDQPQNPQSPGGLAANQNGQAQLSPPSNGHLQANRPSPHQPESGPIPAPWEQEGQGPVHSPAGTGCRRIVGFLFKRPCGRSNSEGCNDCANGYSSQAYASDYELYEGFGHYGPGDWGYGLLANQNQT